MASFFTFVACFSPLFVSCQYNHHLEGRIVNGIPISANKYPWIVSLRRAHYINGSFYFTGHGCGGSLIQTSPPIIMSAAHCFDGLIESDDGSIHSEYGRTYILCDVNRTHPHPHEVSGDIYQTHYISKYRMIHMHPKWNTTKFWAGYDIALLINPRWKNWTLDYGNDSLPLIPKQLDSRKPCCAVDEELLVIGYGANVTNGTGSYSLEIGTVCYVDQRDCEKEYGREYSDESNHLFCANGNLTNVCNGDSGGPIVRNVDGISEIVGIVSFGRNCADGASAVGVRVAHFHDWMMKVIDYEVLGLTWAPTIQPTPSPAMSDNAEVAVFVSVGFVTALVLICIAFNAHIHNNPNKIALKSSYNSI